MPCYTVRLTTVEFKADNERILQEAARLLNWSYQKNRTYMQIGPVQVLFDRKQAQARNQEDINALKRAYSKAAVKAAAVKVHGWTLDTWTTKGTTMKTTAIKY